MSQYDRREIEKRAYTIWEQEGCPHGKDEEHWTRAVAELEREASQRSKAKASARTNTDKQPPLKTAGQPRSGPSARRGTAAKPAESKAAKKATK
ncbi:MAG: DUF2934 domain-containing protein [Hyphomicrobiales bacterium]|nr:DUF2934 domain-containing protein [Hyphomicrobiales bacterium]